MSKSIYAIVTEKIMDSLKKGIVPWRMPWKQSFAIPCNFVSKKPYRGINIWLLMLQGYGTPYWLSFKQCSDLGGKVKKGEHSTLVIYWKIIENKEIGSDGNLLIKKVPLLRFYKVFNVEQCEGLRVPEMKEEVLDFKPLELAEAVVDGYMDKPEIHHKENRAFYRPSTDEINMPKKEKFTSVDGYYSTLFHELVHSSGARERLGREGIAGELSSIFGDEVYSKEELIAEFGASFLCGLCGIETTLENSASYIKSWLG